MDGGGTATTFDRNVPALDGVRGLAILAVVLAHVVAHHWRSMTPMLVPRGYLGVDLFFVLSGFLITRLLLEEHARTGRISFPKFYKRRALRLLPPLAALLVAQVIYAAIVGIPLATELKTLALVVGYVLNWAMAFGTDLAAGLGHLWSLSVEEQFYLVWPVVVVLVAKRPRLLALVIGGGIVVATVARVALYAQATSNVYHRTDTRADALLFGAAVAVAHARGLLTGRVWRLGGWVGAAMFGALVLLPRGLGGGKLDEQGVVARPLLTAAAVAGALLVAGVLHGGRLAQLLSHPWLRTLGIVSYALYLWHAFIILVLFLHTDIPAVPRLALGLGLSAFATWASWHFIERPLRDRRRRNVPHAPVEQAPAETRQSEAPVGHG